jgi:acyl carrier protein
MSLDHELTLAVIKKRVPSLARVLQPAAQLGALELDSLDQVELMLVIHELFSVRLEPDDFQPERTVRELAERIAARAEEVPQA